MYIDNDGKSGGCLSWGWLVGLFMDLFFGCNRYLCIDVVTALLKPCTVSSAGKITGGCLHSDNLLS